MTCSSAVRHWICRTLTLSVAAVALVAASIAQPVWGQGMDLKQASGVPLPANDLPAGTVSVRVVRDSFANNLANQAVVFTVNGAERTVVTDASGRAQVAGLAGGTRVKASALVGEERLESQEVTIAETGIRFVLVATSPVGSAAAAAPGAAPAVVAGTLTLGNQSRIVVDFADERLNVYYVVAVINPAASPVDLGGPLVFELPSSARGTTVMDGSSPNAKANGARVVVTGPFPPGQTDVNIAYELPFSGSAARLEQAWPADAQPFSIFALKTGNIDIESPQITGKRSSSEQGQPLVLGTTPALTRGQPLAISITGLPSHPVWPRNTALGAASVILLAGLWAAFGPASRRRTA
jgi:hypothetical protein